MKALKRGLLSKTDIELAQELLEIPFLEFPPGALLKIMKWLEWRKTHPAIGNTPVHICNSLYVLREAAIDLLGMLPTFPGKIQLHGQLVTAAEYTQPPKQRRSLHTYFIPDVSRKIRTDAPSRFSPEETAIYLDLLSSAGISSRNKELISLYLNGATLEQVASQYGMTRERVRQISFNGVIAARRAGQKLLGITRNTFADRGPSQKTAGLCMVPLQEAIDSITAASNLPLRGKAARMAEQDLNRPSKELLLYHYEKQRGLGEIGGLFGVAHYRVAEWLEQYKIPERVAPRLSNTPALGTVMGRLTFLNRLPIVAGKRKYLCLCSCGTEKAINASDFSKGLTKSCGCLQKDYWASHTGRPKHSEYADKIVEMYAQFYTQTRISAELGIPVSSVVRILKQHKVHDPLRPNTGVAILVELTKQRKQAKLREKK